MPSIDTLVLCPGAGLTLPPPGEDDAGLMAALGFDLAVITQIDGAPAAATAAFLIRLRQSAREGLLLPRFVFMLRKLDESFAMEDLLCPEDCLVAQASAAGLAAARRLAGRGRLLLRGRLDQTERGWLAPAAQFLRDHGQALLILDGGRGPALDMASWPAELGADVRGQVLAVAGHEVRYHAGEALARDVSLAVEGQSGGLRLTVGERLWLDDPQGGAALAFKSREELLAHLAGRYWCWP